MANPSQLVQVIDKTLSIAVNKLVKRGDPLLSLNSVVNMSKKRVFHKTIEVFAAELNDALAEVPSILEPYLAIHECIANGEVTPENKLDLVDSINECICSNEELLNYIFTKVETNYDINIESESNKENQLQFTNVYAKRIIASAIMARIVFPLLCAYMNVNNIRKEDELFLEMIDKIFSYFNVDDEGEPLDLLTKIQKFVATSVENTMYSDKVIWSYLKNLSITETTVSLEIHRNLLCNIIPKLEINKSVVSFFHVVIKKQIEYQFTSNFKITYKPISIIRTDNETINPFIKIEQRLLRNVSEFTLVMMKEDIRNFIEANSELDEDDLFYHLQNITIHTAQTKLLSFFISKQIGRGIPIMSLTKEEYIEILFIAKRWFENNGYRFIGFILVGIPMPKCTVKRNFHKGKHLLEITQSLVYKNIEKRYTLMGDKVNQNVIISFIGEIINTDFEAYTMPDGSDYQSDETPSLKSVMVELLTFIESL